MKHTELQLYGDIGFTHTGQAFASQLAELENRYTHLTIHLHSGGGSVFEGNVIYNAIQRSKMHIKIIVDGMAASMASIILLAANEVEICENAFIMIHRPVTGGSFNLSEIQQEAKLLHDLENNFVRCYAAKTGLAENDVRAKWFDGSDHWLNADEAVKLGFADRKVQPLAKGIKTPDINDVAKLDVKNIYNRYAANLNNKNDNNMKQLLIDTFRLEGVTVDSTDNEIVEKLREKFEQNQNESKAAVTSLVNKAVTDGLIAPSLRATYQEIGEKNGIATLFTLFGTPATTGKPVTIASLIQDARHDKGEKSKKDWTLEDYRMHAPNELRDNPKLYNELVNKEYGNNN